MVFSGILYLCALPHVVTGGLLERNSLGETFGQILGRVVPRQWIKPKLEHQTEPIVRLPALVFC
jgi:hypothetical protein